MDDAEAQRLGISADDRRRYVKAHHVAWALHFGKWPKQKVNHRNGRHRDKWITNLRDVDHQTCHRNCKLSASNTTGAAGVTWNRRNPFAIS